MALLLGSFAVVAIGAEAVLRWAFPYRYFYRHAQFVAEGAHGNRLQHVFADDLIGPALELTKTGTRYRLRPNLRGRLVSSEFDVSFETNDRGLRGPPIAEAADLRILGLGDSFAMGYGVESEETYLAVLADLWATSSGNRVEAINAGVVGYNPYNSFAYLSDQGIALRPDLVLLQLWAGDDLCGPSEAARPAILAEESFAHEAKKLLRSSHLAMLARDRLRAAGPIRRWLMERGMINPMGADLLLSGDLANRCASSLAELGVLLHQFQLLCNRHELAFAVLLVPLREQVYQRDWERAAAYDFIELEPEGFDLDAPSRILRDLAHRKAVELIDATDALREQRETQRLYFDGLDPHLNPAGHAVIGRALFERLAR